MDKCRRRLRIPKTNRKRKHDEDDFEDGHGQLEVCDYVVCFECEKAEGEKRMKVAKALLELKLAFFWKYGGCIGRNPDPTIRTDCITCLDQMHDLFTLLYDDEANMALALCFDLDHVDPTIKLYSVGMLSLNIAKIEIEKTVPRCCPDHLLKTWNLGGEREPCKKLSAVLRQYRMEKKVAVDATGCVDTLPVMHPPEMSCIVILASGPALDGNTLKQLNKNMKRLSHGLHESASMSMIHGDHNLVRNPGAKVDNLSAMWYDPIRRHAEWPKLDIRCRICDRLKTYFSKDFVRNDGTWAWFTEVLRL